MRTGPSRENRALAIGGGVKSGVASFFTGAGAGTKGLGGITKAVKTVAGANESARQKYAMGLTPKDLIAASTLGKIEMDYSSRIDREIAPLMQQRDAVESIPKFLEKPDAVFKKTGFGQTLASKLQNREINGDDYKDAYKKYMNWQGIAEIVGVGANGHLDTQNLDQLEQTGVISTAQKTEFLNADTEMFNISNRIGISVKEEKGLQSVLRQTFKEINTKAAGSSVIRDTITDAIGPNDVVTYDNLDKVVTKSYGVIENYNDEIGEKTYGDPRYNASKAAKETTGNSK